MMNLSESIKTIAKIGIALMLIYFATHIVFTDISRADFVLGVIIALVILIVIAAIVEVCRR
jgi:hypothetical protein